MNYFVQVGSDIQGPISRQEIRQRLAQGEIQKSTLVREVNAEDWETMDALKKAWWAEWWAARWPTVLIALMVAVLLGAVGYSWWRSMREMGHLTVGVNNCRAVITGMRLYSTDNFDDAILGTSPPPLPRSSNAYFRKIVIAGLANEMVFGCPNSIFQPDGKIGAAPDYREALKPGENHWAMAWGLTDASPVSMPLVFENPSVASWPPKWNADFTGTGKRGRTWSGGKVIVSFNDGSVSLQTVEDGTGPRLLKPKADGTAAFSTLNGEFPILDVEDKEH